MGDTDNVNSNSNYTFESPHNSNENIKTFENIRETNTTSNTDNVTLYDNDNDNDKLTYIINKIHLLKNVCTSLHDVSDKYDIIKKMDDILLLLHKNNGMDMRYIPSYDYSNEKYNKSHISNVDRDY